MEYRLLGRSGLKISTLTIGTVTFGGDGIWGQTDVKDAARQVDLCLDHGVNLLDTADVYNHGVSEEISGEVLKENGRRKKMMVATKVRFRYGDGPNDQGLSRYHIIEQCEGSLKRLKTDVIDLYQVHQWDGSTPLEETMEALDTLIRQGKVRYIGCSNYSAWHLMKSLAISDKHNYQRFVGQQIHYSLHTREPEYELVPLGIDQGVGILVWSPLAGGWLSGKFTRDKKPDTGRHVIGFKEPPIYDWEKLWDIVDVIVSVAREHGVSGAQIALAWLLQKPNVTSVIMGGRTIEQFEDNLKSVNVQLTPDQLKRLNDVSLPPLNYPYWHQNWSVYDRMSPADLSYHANYPRPER
jgi:aryl-alcohol dehydrogenase-like predicted oxidoreductase